ncbi:hypothetical protein [Sinomicrobium sp. M5D2P9]
MSSSEKLIAIKEASLSNNCPECYTDTGLTLTFYQKHIENRWFKKVTGEVSNTLCCNKCNSVIYPVKWTDDIERVMEYYTKTVIPNRTSFRLSRLSFILILLLIVIVTGIFAMLHYTGYGQGITTAP